MFFADIHLDICRDIHFDIHANVYLNIEAEHYNSKIHLVS